MSSEPKFVSRRLKRRLNRNSKRQKSSKSLMFQSIAHSLSFSSARFLHRSVINRRTICSLSLPMSSWSCKKCTFLNPPSQKAACKICLSPSSPPPSPSSSSASQWSCKACTFLNPYKNSDCELCGTRAPSLSLSSFKDLIDVSEDADADSSVGSVFFPLQPCKKRKLDDPVPVVGGVNFAELGAFRGVKASTNTIAEMGDSSSRTNLTPIKILTYNVWFREDLEMRNRMRALGQLIQRHSPDVICFQEVTPDIYNIFQITNWWKVYRCSVKKDAHSRGYFCMLLSKLPVKSFSCQPFSNSIMGRELCVANLEVQNGLSLTVATSHLESPCPAPPKWNQMYSKERVIQAKEAIDFLNENPNVVFGGDMNWDDKSDGQFPFPDNWIDAWEELRPGENGWTYDTKSNKMLSGNRTLQRRLDRFVCKLQDFKVSSIVMIGTDPIPELTYTKEKKVGKEMKMLELPVLPSDHYGLLLTISSL
ncbi:uncharacterized protein LOC111456698 [Cucurbita moschata]|uniref:Uncharacterized protein LOC111456698 n=1 Tax=Cucurbita moschata TaxID=3662 RepID=A0A6J1GQX2_CUCMO|nr:uncharacterized protein LOC111456698 [Cucurbita moschata]